MGGEEETTSGYSFLSQLAKKYEIEELPTTPPQSEQDPEIEARNNALDNDFMEARTKNFLEMKRRKLEEQARMREERLRGMSNNSLHQDDFKEKLDVPAYQRKQVRLNDATPSSERNISRFNLNDDNEIMGDNKFLHDNVD